MTLQMLEMESRGMGIRSRTGLARTLCRGALARAARRNGREATNRDEDDWPSTHDEVDFAPYAELHARERIAALRSALQQDLAIAVLLGRSIETWAQSVGKSAAAVRELVQRTTRSLGKMP